MNKDENKVVVSVSNTSTYINYASPRYVPAQQPAPMRVLTKEEIEAKSKKQTEKSKMQIVGEKIVQALKAFLIFYIKLAIFILLVRVVKYVLREG
jgi:uncharacterized membrane protein